MPFTDMGRIVLQYFFIPFRFLTSLPGYLILSGSFLDTPGEGWGIATYPGGGAITIPIQ